MRRNHWRQSTHSRQYNTEQQMIILPPRRKLYCAYRPLIFTQSYFRSLLWDIRRHAHSERQSGTVQVLFASQRLHSVRGNASVYPLFLGCVSA